MQPLPIDALEPDFVSACRPGARLVVSAPTGSGKSTRLPWWMSDALGGAVLVVEPRRVAARALATYGASQRGEDVGDRVGYRVRFDAAESAQTEILFVTPGMALALLANPDGRRFAGVLVDEFHERGWETDLVTALVQDGRAGSEVALVVCSATLARDALCEALDAQPLSGEGRAFEVDVRWDGSGGPSTEQLPERVGAAVREELSETTGDVLVFLPGKREIGACAAALRPRCDADVVVLHGGVSAAEMQAALRPAARRRVFLATNVAETSLTLPSVTAVVDSGLERRHVHRRGKVVLSIEPISMASAEQRRGRAGRVQAGRCVRLWSRAFSMSATTPPQVERIEVDDVLLRVGMCGVKPSDVSALPWVTSPPTFAVEAALRRLRRDGAVDADGGLTEAGQTQARLPVSSAGARLLTDPPKALAKALCEVVALVEVGRELLMPDPSERQAEARQVLFEDAVDEVDVALRCLRDGDAQRHGLWRRTVGECRRLASSLKRHVGAPDVDPPEHRTLARWVATRLTDHVFVRRARADRARKPSRGGEPWGNGEVELFVSPYRVPSVDDPPKPPTAGVVLEREWLGQGQRARGVGRFVLGLTMRELGALELGELEVDRLRVASRTVVADVVRTFAGITLSRGTEALEGEPLRQALVTLVLRGTCMKGMAVRVEDAVHGWSVMAQWARREGLRFPDAPTDAVSFLRARFDTLGVEGLDDLDLLDASDVLPSLVEMGVEAGLDPRIAAGLPEQFPRILEVPGGRYACAVDVPTRTVELTPIGGTKKEPAAGLLPRFHSFSVVFVKASRRLRLR